MRRRRFAIAVHTLDGLALIRIRASWACRCHHPGRTTQTPHLPGQSAPAPRLQVNAAVVGGPRRGAPGRPVCSGVSGPLGVPWLPSWASAPRLPGRPGAPTSRPGAVRVSLRRGGWANPARSGGCWPAASHWTAFRKRGLFAKFACGQLAQKASFCKVGLGVAGSRSGLWSCPAWVAGLPVGGASVVPARGAGASLPFGLLPAGLPVYHTWTRYQGQAADGGATQP